MIELEPIELGLLLLAAATIGGFAHDLWHSRRSATDAICPVCLGATKDDGTFEAFADD